MRLAPDSGLRTTINRLRRRLWHLLAHRMLFGERARDGRLLACTRIAPSVRISMISFRPRPGLRTTINSVPGTGAYCRSLSSQYNHTPRPPVVAVRGGRSRVIVRRETIDDLLTQVLASQYNVIQIQSNGTGWDIL